MEEVVCLGFDVFFLWVCLFWGLGFGGLIGGKWVVGVIVLCMLVGGVIGLGLDLFESWCGSCVVFKLEINVLLFRVWLLFGVF